MDGSLLGWGPHTGDLCVRSTSSVAQMHHHISYLKLLAALLALHSFLPHLQDHTVASLSENTSCHLYKPTRGSCFKIPLQTGSPSLGFLHRPRHYTIGCTCSGNAKYYG